MQSVKAMLYILQHGEAVSKNENPDRPLSDKGRLDIQRLAENIFNDGMNIKRVLHSDKLRAEQTARIIADQLGPTINLELCSTVKPNSNVDEFIEEQSLEKRMTEGNLMIVSHMPFVSNLCSTLLTGSVEVKFDFSPGSLACLFYQYEEWSMEFMIRPETY